MEQLKEIVKYLWIINGLIFGFVIFLVLILFSIGFLAGMLGFY